MAKPIGYRQLRVWQESMELVERVFELTNSLPATQRFCLTSQMHRSSVSIPSNIAEGHAKRSTKDYHRHLKIAAGSLAELETQIELSVRLKYIPRENAIAAWTKSQTVARMLSRLIDSVSPSRKKTKLMPNP